MAGNRELNKYLNELSKGELIKEVTKLHSKFKLVKEYYASELGTDNGALLKIAKAKMCKLILKTGRSIKPDLASANKLIRDFSKVSVYPVDIIDLMLYKVELCTDFLEQWGLQFPNVESAIYTTYPQVLKLIYENKLEKTFCKRCLEVEAVAGNYGLINETFNTDDEDETGDN